jgi:hypothetical protein
MRNRRVVGSSPTCGVNIYNDLGQLFQLPFFFFSLEKSGTTPGRVEALVTSGRLPGTKFGRDFMIKEADLRLC